MEWKSIGSIPDEPIPVLVAYPNGRVDVILADVMRSKFTEGFLPDFWWTPIAPPPSAKAPTE